MGATLWARPGSSPPASPLSGSLCAAHACGIREPEGRSSRASPSFAPSRPCVPPARSLPCGTERWPVAQPSRAAGSPGAESSEGALSLAVSAPGCPEAGWRNSAQRFRLASPRPSVCRSRPVPATVASGELTPVQSSSLLSDALEMPDVISELAFLSLGHDQLSKL